MIFVYGIVKEFHSKKPIPQATVQVFDVHDPEHRMTVLSDSLGRYELSITEERTYRIAYSVEGYYAKSLVIDATGPTQEQWLGGYGLSIDIVLLPELKDFDMDFGIDPLGHARFNPATDNFEWDVEYTQAMQERNAAAMEAYKARMGITE